ncbi:MAG TPA: DUF1330 domain-containing protein [Crenalkalicoccus sp.]|jgi:uncharacterized protein (DUF1330 family)|nr:DUF1330 domain-containing protein [Crenalkalicoccus sp.]
MPGYIIALITVRDQAEYDAYRAAVGPVVARHGGRFLVRGAAFEVAEGEIAPDRLVVLEFPSLAAAQGFYRSEAYAPLLRQRAGATTSRVFIAEGAPPA